MHRNFRRTVEAKWIARILWVVTRTMLEPNETKRNLVSWASWWWYPGNGEIFSVKGNMNSATKAGSLGKMCLTHPLPSLFVILLSYFSTSVYSGSGTFIPTKCAWCGLSVIKDICLVCINFCVVLVPLWGSLCWALSRLMLLHFLQVYTLKQQFLPAMGPKKMVLGILGSLAFSLG